MIELLLQAERLLSVGLLDKAEQLYRQVANADPKNSIAVVGLARVTLDRGDDEGALELARRAVAIDPENAAAQRLVARLEEVLEYRQSAESLLFDRTEAVSALQAEVAADVAAEVGAMPGGDEAVETSVETEASEPEDTGEGPGASGTAEAAGTVPAADAAEAAEAPAGPNDDTAPGAPMPPPAADTIGDGENADEPVAAPPTPAAPPARTDPTPVSPSPTTLNAGPADPPWADVKVPEPEPAPPPAVEPQVPYIPPSTSATAGDDGATAQTGILGYLERLFRRR